jgi:hypothetical protein
VSGRETRANGRPPWNSSGTTSNRRGGHLPNRESSLPITSTPTGSMDRHRVTRELRTMQGVRTIPKIRARNSLRPRDSAWRKRAWGFSPSLLPWRAISFQSLVASGADGGTCSSSRVR